MKITKATGGYIIDFEIPEAFAFRYSIPPRDVTIIIEKTNPLYGRAVEVERDLAKLGQDAFESHREK